MARGIKTKNASRQKRQARQIEDGEKKRGTSTKRAAPLAYATVGKQDGGATKKEGGGRGRKRATSPSRKGGQKTGRARRGTRVGARAQQRKTGRTASRK